MLNMLFFPTIYPVINELNTVIIIIVMTLFWRYMHQIILRRFFVANSGKPNGRFAYLSEISICLVILFSIFILDYIVIGEKNLEKNFLISASDLRYFSNMLFLYPIGSICFGPIIAYFAGIQDLTKVGSGNSGATNVARVGGLKLGGLVLLLDGLKGAILTSIIMVFGYQSIIAAITLPAIWHAYPLFQNIRGGKSVAVAIGTIAIISPICLLFGAILWLGIFYFTKIVSLASLVAIWGIFLVNAIFSEINLATTIGFFLLAAIISLRHQENIIRIIRGNEKKFTPK